MEAKGGGDAWSYAMTIKPGKTLKATATACWSSIIAIDRHQACILETQKMTHRERILAALNRKGTDRTPVDLWHTPECAGSIAV